MDDDELSYTDFLEETRCSPYRALGAARGCLTVAAGTIVIYVILYLGWRNLR